jgi:hypothetical protein
MPASIIHRARSRYLALPDCAGPSLFYHDSDSFILFSPVSFHPGAHHGGSGC